MPASLSRTLSAASLFLVLAAQAKGDKDSKTIRLKAVGHDGKVPTAKAMRSTIAIMKQRLKNAKVAGVSVKLVGKQTVNVTLPTREKEKVRRVTSLNTRPGTIEFALLANEVDHASIIKKATNVERDLVVKDKLVAGWRNADTDSNGKPKEIGLYGRVARRRHPTKKDHFQFLVFFRGVESRIAQKYFVAFRPFTDDKDRPVIAWELNKTGAKLLAKLTGENRPKANSGFKRRLAVLVDDRIVTAPQINSQIGATGIFNGSYSREEIDDFIATLKVGRRLPVKVHVIDGKP